MAQFPELLRLEDEKEREAVRRTAVSWNYRRWQFWTYLVMAPAVVVPCLVLSIVWLRDRGLWPGWMPDAAVFGGIIGGLLTGTYQFVFRRPIRRRIRELLAERGVPICVECGYDLRGSPEPRCPECGRPTTADDRPEDRALTDAS